MFSAIRTATSGIAVATVMAMGSASNAAMVTEPGAPYANEASFSEILANSYGGTFSRVGNDYVGTGGVTASLLADDELFDFANFEAEVLGAFAKYRQSFGIIDENGDYEELFVVAGRNFLVNGRGSTSPTAPFAFARDGDMGIRASTRATDNPFGVDHALVYEITGLNTDPGERILAIFFEDQPRNISDFDYQDLVVEVRGIESVIPSPATGALAALGTLAMLARRRAGK